jgi:hypothetical protein
MKGWFLTPQFLADRDLAELQTWGAGLARRGVAQKIGAVA